MRGRATRAIPVALAAFAVGAAVPASPAGADVSATFASSVRLVDQPAGRPWAIRLRTAAEFADSEGVDHQPVLNRLTFRLPDATVNAGGVRTCSFESIVSVASDFDPCPTRLAVGTGTSDVQLRRPAGIDRHGRPPFYDYHLRLALYIGPRTARGRILMVIGNGLNSPLTVSMRGLLRRAGAGWVFELPIPVVRDPEIGVMKVLRFSMTAGGWTRARPRRWFIEAPRTCPDAGFSFTMETQFEGLAPLSTTRTIACELMGR